MKKFWILLAKETRELLTLQMILPLVITVFVFMGIGNIMSTEQKKVETTQSIAMIDRDGTPASAAMKDVLEKSRFTVKEYNVLDRDAALGKVKEGKEAGLIIVPQGFQAGIQTGQPQKVEMYSVTRNFSFTGAKSYAVLKSALQALNDYFSSQTIAARIPGTDPAVLKNPIKTEDYVVIGDRMAKTNPDMVMAFVSQQTTFIPIILFFVIVFSAQMIATAIATEKENKTLETLLSAPVSRTGIVGAKMLAAGIVAFVSSAIYMVGFRSYIDGMSGTPGTAAKDQLGEVARQLGLTLTPGMYVVLGVSLFAGILVALAISIILGAFAEDVKSLQGLLTPLMVLVMIPYLLVLLLDVQSISPAMRYLLFAIPFSHPFMAAPNLFLHNYAPVAYGIAYQLAVFLVLLWIASRIFSTDRIVTMKLSFGKKRA